MAAQVLFSMFFTKKTRTLMPLSAVSKAKVQQLLRAFKRKCFGEYDAVTLTMLYLKVFHDMVSQNS